jgi:hypothetical protein
MEEEERLYRLLKITDYFDRSTGTYLIIST